MSEVYILERIFSLPCLFALCDCPPAWAAFSLPLQGTDESRCVAVCKPSHVMSGWCRFSKASLAMGSVQRRRGEAQMSHQPNEMSCRANWGMPVNKIASFCSGPELVRSVRGPFQDLHRIVCASFSLAIETGRTRLTAAAYGQMPFRSV